LVVPARMVSLDLLVLKVPRVSKELQESLGWMEHQVYLDQRERLECKANLESEDLLARLAWKVPKDL